MIKEFNINFTEKVISLIYQKVKDYPWDSIVDLESWDHGTNKEYLKELCNYWVKDFDWDKHELELNKFSNFTTNVDGEDGKIKAIIVTHIHITIFFILFIVVIFLFINF